MKRRLLCLMASLLLCGVVSAQNYWGDDPDSHAQPSNTPIVASIQVNGEAASLTEGCRLGAFVNNELRGIAAPHTDGKFWIQVFYTTTTDNITFKFYDGTTEYTTCATTLTGSDAGYGTPTTPEVLNFTNAAEQTMALSAGWSWWSTNLEITLTDLQQALAAVEGNSSIRILADDTRATMFNGTSWRGTLNSLDVTKFYKIQNDVACEITLTGSPINPTERTITIIPGYNWLGYPYTDVKTLSTVFNGFAASGDRVVAGDTKAATFNGTSWRGTLTNLEPGKGYMYYSGASENRTFTFPAQ